MERSEIELAWLGAKARSEMERSGIELAWLGRKPAVRWSGAESNWHGWGESPVYDCGKSIVEIFGIF